MIDETDHGAGYEERSQLLTWGGLNGRTNRARRTGGTLSLRPRDLHIIG